MRALALIAAAALASPAVASAASYEQTFPYAREAVFHAVVAELPGAGFKVRDQDPAISRVVATKGMTAVSWGSRYSIAVEDGPSPSTSVLHMDAAETTLLGSATGEPQRAFDRLVFAVSRRLQADAPPAP